MNKITLSILAILSFLLVANIILEFHKPKETNTYEIVDACVVYRDGDRLLHIVTPNKSTVLMDIPKDEDIPEDIKELIVYTSNKNDPYTYQILGYR